MEIRRERAEAQLQRERAVAQARLIGGVAWQWTKNALLIVVPLLAVGLAAWAVLRKLSIIPSDAAGGYPLLLLRRFEVHWPRRHVDENGETRWLALLAFRTRLVDPNRNPTVGIELGREVRFIQPDRVTEPQMQITTQAQVVQAERARASGNVTIASGRSGSRRLGTGEQPIVIYPRALPEPRREPIDTAQVALSINEQAHVHEA